MTRITGADHVLLLLREKLSRAERERAGAPGKAAIGRTGSSPLERLRAMTGLDALSGDERRRAVVHGLLADELGDAVVNDASFGAVLDDVMRIIGDLPGGPELVDRAAVALREG